MRPENQELVNFSDFFIKQFERVSFQIEAVKKWPALDIYSKMLLNTEMAHKGQSFHAVNLDVFFILKYQNKGPPLKSKVPRFQHNRRDFLI